MIRTPFPAQLTRGSMAVKGGRAADGAGRAGLAWAVAGMAGMGGESIGVRGPVV